MQGAGVDIVDSHMHVWDPQRFTYPWFAGDTRLDRPYLPQDYRAQVPAPTSLVFVEAACLPQQSLAEVRWVLSQARETGLPVHAVVAAAPLDEPAALAVWWEEIDTHPLVRGARRGVYGTPDDVVLGADFGAGLRQVADRGLAFDVSGHWNQLATFAQAAEAVPDLLVVVDHVGKPHVAAGWDSEERHGWSQGLQRLAAREDAVLKLSGLVPETPAHLDLEDAVRPFVQHALDLFGPQRCMVGSDWPMSTSEPGPRGVAAWQHLVLDGSGLDPAERAAVASGTARRTYRLPAAPDDVAAGEAPGQEPVEP